MTKQLKPYPIWVCRECGYKAALSCRCMDQVFTVSTWHTDECGVCGAVVACTEPRDFGYPLFEGCEA